MSSPYDLLSAYDDEYVAVKQATSQGYILCEWGGGSRPILPDKQITQRKSSRARSDLPHIISK